VLDALRRSMVMLDGDAFLAGCGEELLVLTSAARRRG
jgi:hypothetical protein